MADPIQTGFLSLTDRLCKFLPIIGGCDLAIAWVGHFAGFSNTPFISVLAGVTLLAGMPIFLRSMFGSRGLRSVAQRGFSSIASAWWYTYWFKGYAPFPLAITLMAFGTGAALGRIEGSQSSAVFLAISVFWSVGIVAKFTRRWPSDDRLDELPA